MASRPANWAGNVAFGAARFHRPGGLPELQRLVAASKRAHALGTGHSFNAIADTAGDLISVAQLPRVIELDAADETVRVSAAVRYGELASRLQAAGFALRNLGSLPHISIAGACATATHGSGDSTGNLATSVSGLEMVTADGNLATIRRSQDDEFRGAVVGLGALGIVTSLTLKIVPTFDVRQYVYDNMPRAALYHHFAEIFASGYSVSAFTGWRGEQFSQVWLKRRADDESPLPGSPWMGATLADGPRHPVPGMPAVNCTEQLGVPGPWHQRLPHFRLEFTPSSGAELQSEYLVPRELAVDALRAIDDISHRVAPVLQVSEVRTVAADELWMSPSYQRETAAIHFTWIKDVRAVLPVLAAVEDQLAPFQVRPHWGKLFGTSPESVRAQYERLVDFQRLVRRYDPAGKFRNDFLDAYVQAEG